MKKAPEDTPARVAEIYQQILSRAPEHQIDPTLQRVSDCLDILGDPQKMYRAVHITGTNGKTSTARMIEGLLEELGYRTGRFTSPHLSDVRERICIDGQMISPERFVAAWEDIAPYVEMVDGASRKAGGPQMSFFEVFTVMAYAAFADAPVDIAVVEVGMGGRWDATNVIDAGVSVITPISLEHQKWLGSTIHDIAVEKSGIIKPGGVAVVSRQPEAALEVIEAACRDNDAHLYLAGRDFAVVSRQRAVGGQLLTIQTPAARYEDIYLPLFGEHQAENLAQALVATEAILGGRALEAAGVEKAIDAVRSPGRLEVVRSSPMIVVDATHNPGGAVTLAAAIRSEFAWNHTVGVCAMMADKDAENIFAELEPVMDKVIITSMNSPRAANPEDLAEIAGEVFDPDDVEVYPQLADAIDAASAYIDSFNDPQGVNGVVVFGSVVLAGNARDLLLPGAKV